MDLYISLIFLLIIVSTSAQNDSVCSGNGVQLNDELCNCFSGFDGAQCQDCRGRFIKNGTSGTITTGSGSNHEVDCLGIITSQSRINQSVQIEVKNPSPPCHCDILTIYDGDSLHSPILATFKGNLHTDRERKVVASSDSVTLQFYNKGRDFEETGYDIKYKIAEDGCPFPCQNSSYFTSSCDGPVCSYSWIDALSQGRAATGASVVAKFLFVYGGQLFGSVGAQVDFMRLNLDSYEWSIISSSDNSSKPERRQSHTLTARKDSLIVYGGAFPNFTITNQMWVYNITNDSWCMVIPANNSLQSPPLIGHSSHVVTYENGGDVMLVFFGYSSKWRINPFVFEFSFDEELWSRLNTSGAIPVPTYMHGSVLDDDRKLIYIHGGYNNMARNELYCFNFITKYWSILPSSPDHRYFHSISLVGNHLYTLGGKKTSSQACPSCSYSYSMKYNRDCMEWNVLDEATLVDERIGHSAIHIGNRQILIYGGYDGTMLSDVIMYNTSLSNCSSFLNSSECCNATGCDWKNESCVEGCATDKFQACNGICQSSKSCFDCYATPCDCCFDGDCTFINESATDKSQTHNLIFELSEVMLYDIKLRSLCNSSSCGRREDMICNLLTNCQACDEGGCSWEEEEQFCHRKTENHSQTSCPAMCAEIGSCEDCLAKSQCTWCGNTGSCFVRTDSEILFPFGQCTDYVNDAKRCEGDPCVFYQNCDDCFEDFRCGWCDNGSSTGYGFCLSGGLHNPLSRDCPAEQWHFQECPACQCNGHSNCSEAEPSVCASCETGTTGSNCEVCDVMFYGDSTNGKQCFPCVCNGHASDCSKSGGVCSCNVEGITGTHCDECYNGFHGDPVNDTCRYTMAIMTRYRFPLYNYRPSVTTFNLECCPPHDTSIQINLQTTIETPFDVVITTNSSMDQNETTAYTNTNVSSISVSLSQKEYGFGGGRCVRIYVTNLTLPTEVEVWILQSAINLWKLIIVFLITLFSLLIAAALIWKLYLAIVRLRRRRNTQVEMSRLAARPFAIVHVEVEEDFKSKESSCDQVKGSPIVSAECCRDVEATIYTVLLALPRQTESLATTTMVLASCLGMEYPHAKPPTDCLKPNKTRLQRLLCNGRGQSFDNPNYSPDI